MSDTDPLNDDVWLIHLAFRQLIQIPDALLERSSLGRIHHRLLFVIARAGRIRVGDIAQQLEVTRQAIHLPMRQLRERGLLDSTTDPGNRTAQLVWLTPEGTALEDRLTGIQRQHLAQAFAGVPGSAANGWREVMSEIARISPQLQDLD